MMIPTDNFAIELNSRCTRKCNYCFIEGEKILPDMTKETLLQVGVFLLNIFYSYTPLTYTKLVCHLF